MSNEPTPVNTRRHARIGTMVWGAILVGVAIFALVALLNGIVGTNAVLWSVVGFGAFLLVAAVATAIARVATARSEGTDSGHPPIG